MNSPTEVLVPQVNPNDEHAVLVSWHVASGSRVSAEQPLATLETTKATFDLTAPHDGYAFFEEQPKTLVAVGAVIAWIASSADSFEFPRAPVADSPAPVAAASGDAHRFTRKALKRMHELGLTAADFEADERIDVAGVERRAGVDRRAPGRQGQPVAVRTDASSGSAEVLEQTPTKIIEVQTLSEVYRHVVPSTVSMGLSCVRSGRRLQQRAAASGSPSLLELAILEVARLLDDFPDLSGYYADGRAWHYPIANIGFAVNLGRGLRVPVVRGAAGMSLVEVCRKVRDLSLRYMRNELTVEDQSAGTFTITDLSGAGIHHFGPVLNARQSAILGICAERAGSGYRDLVLTFDHRMSDGMRAATFLGELVRRLEQDEPGD